MKCMCYSLFVSPEHHENGRHKHVLRHHASSGKTGKIVGGGLLTANGQTALLHDSSSDFGPEPEPVRKQFAALLLPELQKISAAGPTSAEGGAGSLRSMQVYWLRFRQVMEAVKQYHLESDTMHTFNEEVEIYLQIQKQEQ